MGSSKSLQQKMGSLNKKPHAVLVPFPAQGHITPMMSIGKLLHSRGFHITFVNTEYNHRHLIRSKGPDSVNGFSDFRFETIPDGLPTSDEDITRDVPSVCASMTENSLEPMKKLLMKLNDTPSIPSVSCLIGDGALPFCIKAAEELHIPEVQLWTASVCSFMAYLGFPEIQKRGIWPLKKEYVTDGTLNTQLDWIPGLIDLCVKDLPNFVQSTERDDIMFNYAAVVSHNCLKANAMIFHTFDDFEKEALEAIVSYYKFPNIYSLGPLPLLVKHASFDKHAKSLDSSLWKPDSKVFEWLDSRDSESVVYVNYGSVTTMTKEHLIEFAWGLAKSELPFLWIIRPDIVKGDTALLPEEFLEETKNRGLLVSWCAQEEVLAHKAVGAFLTHCGWNSTMESVCNGLPLICWPFFADQQINCHYSCVKWSIRVEIDHDVKRDVVAELVREVVQGEKGKKMRANAQEWKKKAEASTDSGGSSYVQFEKFAREASSFFETV